MPRSADLTREATLLFKMCLNASESEMPIGRKCEYIEGLRKTPEVSAAITQMILSENGTLRTEVAKLRKNHERLAEVHKAIQEEIERLTAPPLHVATFFRHEMVKGEPRALVCRNNWPQCVSIAEGVDGLDLQFGDEVLLSGDGNILVGRVTGSLVNWGEMAIFDRYAPDGRLVITRRDEELVINCRAALRDTKLNKGDRLRINEATGLAYEKMEPPRGDDFFLQAVPLVTFDQIGGLDKQIAELEQHFALCLERPETAAKYGLTLTRSLLLLGPPGVGKTMIVCALANKLGQLYGQGNARIINVKPGQLGSMWYAQTEANIREVFRAARDAASERPELPVIIFFDEIDSIGGRRGGYFNRVDDRVFDAFAVELEGLEERGNIFVVGATNRLDILDAALVRNGRLGDWVMRVPRPDRKGARAILGKYLHRGLPYVMEGLDSDAAREEILDAGTSQLYSPNGESDIATLMYRDGEQRAVKAAELMSGATLAKLAREAAQRAALRDRTTGESGIRLDDLLSVVTQELEHLGSTLTPGNCRDHLSGLKQDVDVVRVEPVERRATVRAYRYLNIA